MAISHRPLGLLVLGLFGAGCGSSDDPASPADLAGRCGQGWVQACEAAGCDPSNASWSDCRINGWSGYRAPESCPVETGYPGDDAAPCAPKPDEGFQLRFGPADYTDQAEIDKHLIPAGAQEIECVYLALPNTEERFLGQLVGRIRPGVHHTQLRFMEREPTSSSESEFCLPIGGEYLHMGQTPDFEVPDLRVPNPSPATKSGGLDFQGSAIKLEPGRVLALELHYINSQAEPVLREGWVNFYYQKPDDVAAVLNAIQLIGVGIRVPPKSTGVVRRACAAPNPLTITHLQGHSHEGATRFTAWVRRAATGELSRVYESYDPVEPALLTYSPRMQNAEPDRARGRAGGTSGPIHLDAGDSLVWECEIENPGDTPIVDGGPNTNGDQMCYTFGNFIADDPTGESLWCCGAGETPAF
jgi:hypothetical protein